ncbi:Ig domain-containing protein [Paenibacillus hemerocallicola]|uniref:Ig domain-containing protein n=1 Tax=Paenibacillus hemerocallicola TaxID=1172614 RepID=A0A5C4T5W6_9BACL|nr:DUF6273 domain-containing protein [Paenibacillus hemerocallicola]TNJ64474.1 Ig domain-containing protein [Paenibacillus hemerocallicola]
MPQKKRWLSLALATALMTSTWGGVQAQNVDPGGLSEGQYVKFGKYRGESIVWKVVGQDADGSSLLLSERIVSLKPFDAIGDQVDYDGDGTADTADDSRAGFGSNYWEKSTIREWLNSEAETVPYTHQPPDNNHVLGFYNNFERESGFLHDFTSAEKEAIQPVIHKVLLSDRDQGQKDGGTEKHAWSSAPSLAEQNGEQAYYKNVTDTVFVPSISELSRFLIAKGETHAKKPTLQAIGQSELKIPAALQPESNWSYWLRDAYADSSYGVRVVYGNENILAANAGSGAVGVVPALKLKRSPLITGGSGSITDPLVIAGITPVSGVTLDRQVISLKGHHSAKLEAAIIPENATNRSLIWHSTDPEVAVVSADGEIQAIRKGSAYVIVKTGDGGFTAEARVEVNQPEKKP